MGEAASESQKFDPFNDIRKIIQRKHDTGELGYISLALSIVYNFIFFEYPEGYGLYFFLPILSLGTGYFSKYWELDQEKSRNIVIVGYIFLFLGLFIDLFVSISFIPQPNGDYSLLSLPTLIFDAIGVVSLSLWIRRNYSKIAELNPREGEAQEEDEETGI